MTVKFIHYFMRPSYQHENKKKIMILFPPCLELEINMFCVIEFIYIK